MAQKEVVMIICDRCGHSIVADSPLVDPLPEYGFHTISDYYGTDVDDYLICEEKCIPALKKFMAGETIKKLPYRGD